MGRKKELKIEVYVKVDGEHKKLEVLDKHQREDICKMLKKQGMAAAQLEPYNHKNLQEE